MRAVGGSAASVVSGVGILSVRCEHVVLVLCEGYASVVQNFVGILSVRCEHVVNSLVPCGVMAVS